MVVPRPLLFVAAFGTIFAPYLTRAKIGGVFMLRYLTSGESHGKCLIAILEGIPSGLKVDVPSINRELSRRMSG